MSITPEQCRMARAALRMSQTTLARRADVAAATVAEFERGRRTPYERTLRDIQKVFEGAGVKFTDDGVIVKKVQP